VQQVEIRVRGQIDERWQEWLEDLVITHTPEGETVLTGAVWDQSALYGLIARLRDLGLPLVSVNPLSATSEPAPRRTTSPQGQKGVET
jgi:hypothetical protein